MPPKKRSRGRPSLPGSAKVIRLRESVYNLWRARKTAMGFGNTTDSAFAEILWHCSHNGTKASEEIFSRWEYGEERGHRKYSKRIQKIHAETVKEEKAYSYFPFLMAKLLKERCLLEGSFSQKTDDNVFNPKQIAPTIGMKVAPSTEELMKGPSRLAKPPLKKWNSSTGELANHE